MDVELMGVHRSTIKGYKSLCLRAVLKESLTLMNYMLRAWWLRLICGLEKYVIRPGAVAQILVITNNIMTLVIPIPSVGS